MSQDANTTLDAAADWASDWLYGAAMPLWLAHGVDWARGGFHESLTLEELRSEAAFKRLRVLARQIYVFSEGALHEVDQAREAVDHGLNFLFQHARHPEGGFASRQDMHGAIIDSTRDLYDLAFVLFSLAHAHRVTEDERLKQEALGLLTFIQTSMTHSSGGYVEAVPPRAPRRQNPHMHLLEAALACLEHMPDPAFEMLVDELVGLAERRFMNDQRTLLFEYFDDQLSGPVRTHGAAVIEPGHHMEWAWLFREVERVRGVKISGDDTLARFALAHGLDQGSGLLRGELFEDGEVADSLVRLWPHGEWLKAALRVPAIHDTWPDAWSALKRFLDTPTTGLWREQWKASEGRFLDTPAPASSLYHIVTAVTELRRSASRNFVG
jgi:mannose/cellobiose epimerase-like protein (N-acyl-D-glucosamine 2-epimerase family)